MEFIIFIITIILGLVFGKMNEKRHYRSILAREDSYRNIVVLSDRDTRRIPDAVSGGVLLSQGTVVSIDAFKKLMAGFVNIFGGKMKAYESLVDRARREAILRLKQEAEKSGCNALINLRIETSSITKNARQSVGSIEALAYATAIQLKDSGK